MFRLFEENDPFRVEKSLKLFNLEVESNKEYILKEIAKYIFNPKSGKSSTSERNFDLNYDYKYYFVDFLRLGINLNKQDIDWWEFDNILNGIMLDDNSAISKVIGYRTYKKPSNSMKTQQEEHHRFMLKQKEKYRLPILQNQKGFEKMWNYLEKKVGDNKE